MKKKDDLKFRQVQITNVPEKLFLAMRMRARKLKTVRRLWVIDAIKEKLEREGVKL